MSRRRVALALLGLLHLAMVPGLLFRPQAPGDPDLAIFHTLMPIWLRAAMWATAGALAITLSLWRRTERAGWTFVVLMPFERFLSFGWSALMWIIPGWPPGALASFGSAAVWLAITSLILLIAGWPERQQEVSQ